MYTDLHTLTDDELWQEIGRECGYNRDLRDVSLDVLLAAAKENDPEPANEYSASLVIEAIARERRKIAYIMARPSVLRNLAHFAS